MDEVKSPAALPLSPPQADAPPSSGAPASGFPWNIPVRAPAEWLTNNVARNPLVAALLTSLGGYMGGRYAAAPVTSWLLDEDDEKKKKERAERFGVAGGLAGLVPSAVTTWGRMRSTLPHPEAPDVPQQRYNRGEGLLGALTRNFDEAAPTPAAPPLKKISGDMTGYYGVPVQPGTSNMVLMDPYLQAHQKLMVLEAIQKAKNEQAVGPLVTTGDLARGASQAGFGYLGARLLGSVLGLGFGMSSKNQQRLGLGGAIANVLTSIGTR